MAEEIRSYWQQLFNDYEKRHGEAFWNEREKSREYLEAMEGYLRNRLRECPTNVEAICTLASVRLELGDEERDCVILLEDFLHRFEDVLDSPQKTRIYTNIAFYEEYSTRTLYYLNKAAELKSPFVETYRALGLYYFQQFQQANSIKALSSSKKYFELAKTKDAGYIHTFSYAVSLYALREYENAREIFTNLLEEYPDRMRLKLCMAYCEASLGNIAKANYYLDQVKPGQDNNYSLNTDEIAESEIFNVYYVLEDYDKFLTCWSEEIVNEYYTAEFEELFYVLWLKGKTELFSKLADQNHKFFAQSIHEVKLDEDYVNEEERQESIAILEKDQKQFEKMITRIKSGISKPELQLPLEPEFSCFLIDCLRHRL